MDQVQTEASSEKTIKDILEILEIRDLDKATLEDTASAMGYLLSIKARRAPSVHEITKDVRRALKLITRSPLRDDVEMVVKGSRLPFKSGVLNAIYMRILEKLLRNFMEKTSGLSPAWKRKIMNLVVDGVYNAAISLEARNKRKEIRELLKKRITREKKTPLEKESPEPRVEGV